MSEFWVGAALRPRPLDQVFRNVHPRREDVGQQWPVSLWRRRSVPLCVNATEKERCVCHVGSITHRRILLKKREFLNGAPLLLNVSDLELLGPVLRKLVPRFPAMRRFGDAGHGFAAISGQALAFHRLLPERIRDGIFETVAHTQTRGADEKVLSVSRHRQRTLPGLWWDRADGDKSRCTWSSSSCALSKVLRKQDIALPQLWRYGYDRLKVHKLASNPLGPRMFRGDSA